MAENTNNITYNMDSRLKYDALCRVMGLFGIYDNMTYVSPSGKEERFSQKVAYETGLLDYLIIGTTHQWKIPNSRPSIGGIFASAHLESLGQIVLRALQTLPEDTVFDGLDPKTKIRSMIPYAELDIDNVVLVLEMLHDSDERLSWKTGYSKFVKNNGIAAVSAILGHTFDQFQTEIKHTVGIGDLK